MAAVSVTECPCVRFEIERVTQTRAKIAAVGPGVAFRKAEVPGSGAVQVLALVCGATGFGSANLEPCRKYVWFF